MIHSNPTFETTRRRARGPSPRAGLLLGALAFVSIPAAAAFADAESRPDVPLALGFSLATVNGVLIGLLVILSVALGTRLHRARRTRRQRRARTTRVPASPAPRVASAQVGTTDTV